MLKIPQRARRFYSRLTRKPLIRAAHYFSDGWALNFWQVFDPHKATEELAQLKEDGYNTIIVLVPWSGFQPYPFTGQYPDYYWQQLDALLVTAEQANLQVLLRVSYGHHSLPHKGLTDFSKYQRLLFDAELQADWGHYLERINETAGRHNNIAGVFVSWEEFWGPMSALQDRAPAAREVMSAKTGFSQWCRTHGIDLKEIPQRQSERYHHYHQFKNEKIRQLFQLAQSSVPDIGMEMRVDRDPWHSADGIEWLKNDWYADIPGRFSYWAPFMGASNEGERLNAEQGAALLEHMLVEVAGAEPTPGHMIDQFNFVDDTHDEGSTLAKLEDSAVDDFLKLAAPLLQDHSVGYGIWAPRDYLLNVLYNASFLMGEEGWRTLRGTFSSPVFEAGARLSEGSLICQILPSPVSALRRDILVEAFEFELHLKQVVERPDLRVKLNYSDWIALEQDTNPAMFKATIPILNGDLWENGIELKIENRGASCELARVMLYHQCYRGGIRDTEGEPMHLLKAIQGLNRSVSRRR